MFMAICQFLAVFIFASAQDKPSSEFEGNVIASETGRSTLKWVLLGCLYFFMLTAAFSENVFHTNGLVEVRAHAKRVTPACALPSPPFPRLRNS